MCRRKKVGNGVCASKVCRSEVQRGVWQLSHPSVLKCGVNAVTHAAGP